eukprot:1304308-Pyramimonas_sp.AAC.1
MHSSTGGHVDTSEPRPYPKPARAGKKLIGDVALRLAVMAPPPKVLPRVLRGGMTPHWGCPHC